MPEREVNLIDLASERVGGVVLAANDEFFAPKENLLAATAPIYLPDKYVSTGKWMDGWETRRRREPGDDWALIRLGLRGIVETVVVDTSYFRGNFPEECSLDGCVLSGRPDTETLLAPTTHWLELVPRSPLAGDSKNRFTCSADAPVTHLKLRIFPDGGVARLRVYGRAMPDWDWLDYSGGLTDLAAVENGGRVLKASDMFFGAAVNLIMPGRAAHMGEGWETRRRRGPGHDWVILQLGAAGEIMRLEVDTTHFRGNAPRTCAIDVRERPGATLAELEEDDGWRVLLPETRLQPHARHLFQDEFLGAGRATHARLRIYPDGGIARLRLHGRTQRAERLLVGLGKTNALPPAEQRAGFLRCCGSRRFAERMVEAGPYSSVAALMRTANRIWWTLERQDWLEAFAAHPRIGERSSGWSSDEQAGTRGAEAQVMEELAAKNRAYEERYGHVFIVCATGKRADEMLAILESRLASDPEHEIRIAAEEQRKITRIRLERWLVE
jgi:allantoicase